MGQAIVCLKRFENQEVLKAINKLIRSLRFFVVETNMSVGLFIGKHYLCSWQ